jgi:hypothetical protein
MAASILEVPLSDLTGRLDVPFHLNRKSVGERIRTTATLPLSEVCTRIVTRTPGREQYSDEGVPCLKLRNVNGRILNTSNCDFVPFAISEEFVFARKGDIIVTATGEGTAGRVDVFVEDQPYIVTGESLLLRSRGINPFYLVSILRAPFVTNQMLAGVRGATGQTHLYWQDIKNISIPSADARLQQEFEELYLRAWTLRRTAALNLRALSSTLVECSGLAQVPLKSRRTTFEVHSSEVLGAGRFDVEYFQPIHDRITSALLAKGALPVSSVAELNGKTIDPSDSPGRQYKYVDIGSVDIETGDFVPIEVMGHEAPSRARRRPLDGDVIISTVRPARNACAVIDDSEDVVVSTGFAVLTPLAIDPLVLFALLKTPGVYDQLVRASTAAMYPAVQIVDVLDVLIPKVSQRMASHVSAVVMTSMDQRKESNRLLAAFQAKGQSVVGTTFI